MASTRPRCGARPVGERDGRVHPFAGDADRVQPDRVRGRLERADDADLIAVGLLLDEVQVLEPGNADAPALREVLTARVAA